MQWLSVLWTFFYIGPAKELGQYSALMTSHYQQSTEYIYVEGRFVYAVLNIVGNTNTKKKNKFEKYFGGK